MGDAVETAGLSGEARSDKGVPPVLTDDVRCNIRC